MKKFYIVSILLISSLLALTSCEFDTSPEPDYPLYATYTISANYTQFSGPAQLLTDIMQWVKANQDIYDTPVRYSTGAATEFAKTDAEAIERYNEFLIKFKAYLVEASKKVAEGAYGSAAQVNGQFYVYAARTQGQDGNLKSESVPLIYPVSL